MATFESTHRAVLSVRLAPAEARAAWSDPQRQARCRPELASWEVPGPGLLRLRMKEMKHGPTAFAADYTLRFAVEGDRLVWRSLPGGSPQVEGSARFVAAPGGAAVHYEERVSVTMELGVVAAKLLRPIVEAMMERGMRGFAERMAGEL